MSGPVTPDLAHATPSRAARLAVPAAARLVASVTAAVVLLLGAAVAPAAAAPAVTSRAPSAAAARVDPTVAYVTRVYEDLFGRAPDAGGLASWTDALTRGTPRVAVANAITSSPEYRSGLIAGSYADYLGRTPDARGLQDWLAAMQRGMTIQVMEGGFVASAEYYLQAGNTDRAWVGRLYRDVLGRAAGAPEVDHWTGELRRGVSRLSVAMGFLLSTEQLVQEVDTRYRHLLGRPVDASGRASWPAAIQRGHRLEAVVGGIVASQEYYAAAVRGAATSTPAPRTPPAGPATPAAPPAGPPAGPATPSARPVGPGAPATDPGGTGTPVAAGRDAWRHPFASTSPWNTAIGSGARFEPRDGSRTASFLTAKPVINRAEWSVATRLARTTDPVATLTAVRNRTTYTIRIPPDTVATAGLDRHVTVVQPDGVTAFDMYKISKQSDTQWRAEFVVVVDLRRDGAAAGARASGMPGFAGLIRRHEVGERRIPHALAIAVPGSVLRTGQMWPATRQDGDARTSYTGQVPMGSLFAIPPGVDVEAMRLSPEGKALARALQDYGAYVVDRSGMASLYCELSCDASGTERMKVDFRTLFPHLRAVTNNAPSSVGGGGTPRVAAPAGL